MATTAKAAKPRRAAASDVTGDASASPAEVGGDGASGVAPEGVLPDAVREEQIVITKTVASYPADVYSHTELGLSKDDLLAMYRSMLLQRRFEERAAQAYGKQKIAGFLHLYIGQEAVSTGAVNAIHVGKDSVITAYRDHGLGLALGMTAREGMAEMFGRATGSSKGKGGSMHFFKESVGMYGGHGIVGGHVPVGVGLAFAHKYKGDGGLSLTFLGDGAVGQGAVHEALNLAGLWDCPAIVIIENNGYAMGTSIQRAFSEPEFVRLAVGYGIDAMVVNGMDVLTVTKALRDAAVLARSGRPVLVEMRTYRYRGHSMSDPQNYRTKEELDAKKGEDPILRLKAYLLEHQLSTNEVLDAIDEEVKAEVLDAVDFADNSPLPELKDAYDDVYVQEDYPFLK
ncbi:MAG: pyruvate dehydrogenase (acetyl-transferring) E1 component subunit alpha [Bacteroidetes bacterium]|nr:pyruvate dehydrogenase (acetyl-transferring) E1 component subunit alpha [Bacteroidota bacterium]